MAKKSHPVKALDYILLLVLLIVPPVTLQLAIPEKLKQELSEKRELILPLENPETGKSGYQVVVFGRITNTFPHPVILRKVQYRNPNPAKPEHEYTSFYPAIPFPSPIRKVHTLEPNESVRTGFYTFRSSVKLENIKFIFHKALPGSVPRAAPKFKSLDLKPIEEQCERSDQKNCHRMQVMARIVNPSDKPLRKLKIAVYLYNDNSPAGIAEYDWKSENKTEDLMPGKELELKLVSEKIFTFKPDRYEYGVRGDMRRF